MALPVSPEEIFADYQARRNGLLKALTDGAQGQGASDLLRAGALRPLSAAYPARPSTA